MPTRNEEMLKEAVEQLQQKMQEVTTFLEMKKTQEDSDANYSDEPLQVSHSHSFSSEQTVCINLPFYVNGVDVSVDVYIDEGPGKFRAISPLISCMGNFVQIDFDSIKTGVAVIRTQIWEGSNPLLGPTLPIPPMAFMPTHLALITEEPKVVKPDLPQISNWRG